MGSLHDASRFHKLIQERNDVYNEIHSKLVELNHQLMFFNQQLQELKRSCSERWGDEVPFWKKRIQYLVNDQENIKKRLNELLVNLFKNKFANIGNLQGFVLEQEVYRLLGTIKNLEVLKVFITNIEGLTIDVDKKHKRLQDLKMKLDQVPANKSFTTLWNVVAASHGSQTPQPVSDAVAELYGFLGPIASDLRNCIASRRMISEVGSTAMQKMVNDVGSTAMQRMVSDVGSTAMQRMVSDVGSTAMQRMVSEVDSKVDPLDFLDLQILSKNCEKEDPEAENWKHLRKWKQKFECVSLKRQEQNISSSSVLKSEILIVMKHWAFHVESVLWYQIYNVYALVSSYGTGLREFGKLKSPLEELKERRNGMVPIIVYKILAMLNPEVQTGAVRRYRTELYGEIEFDVTELYEEIEFNTVMHTFYRLIILVCNVQSKTSNARAFDKRMLFSCQAELHQCEELLTAINSRIYKLKCRLEVE